MLVGYIRVSSDSDRQTTDLQRDALLSAGVDSRHLTNLAAGDTSVGSTPIWEVGRWLGRVCDGWLNYFAVPGSHRFIRAFPCRLRRLWMRALRRRSQRARFSWRRLVRMTDILWSRVSIRHPWPNQRFAVKHPR